VNNSLVVGKYAKESDYKQTAEKPRVAAFDLVRITSIEGHIYIWAAVERLTWRRIQRWFRLPLATHFLETPRTGSGGMIRYPLSLKN
jgi:hypothetical protein